MARPCNEETCRKVVVFAKDEDSGKWLVLSNSAPMYRVVKYDGKTPIVRKVSDTLLLHFVDCTRPNKFSASKREDPPAQRDFTEPKEVEA